MQKDLELNVDKFSNESHRTQTENKQNALVHLKVFLFEAVVIMEEKMNLRQ